MILRVALPIMIVLAAVAAQAPGEQRFPPPDFETDYTLPSPTTPEPRTAALEWLDVAVLALALILAAWLIHKTRSRKAVFVLMLASLAYFGFYRKGCVCSIGAIQNVALALADPSYTAGWVVVAFFALPLVFALFFGRVFCGAVCPLGAIQDFVLLKPLNVPAWLGHALGLCVYVYLGAAILLAATGSSFIICQYDPFVAFFRLSGVAWILVLGVAVLVIAVFIGRPYCRFLCPYASLLRWAGLVARKRVTITPAECLQCRLCENACPFGAIHPAVTAEHNREHRKQDRLRLGLSLLSIPILAILGGWGVSKLSDDLARAHPTVRLADQVRGEETGQLESSTDASDAFRATGRPIAELYADADAIGHRFQIGAWLLGAFLGLTLAAKAVTLAFPRQRTDYTADAAHCLACARCFEFCPIEQRRRGNTPHKNGSNLRKSDAQ